MKKIICLLVVAVMAFAAMSMAVSAASLTISQVYTANDTYTELNNSNASSVGAVAAHHVWLDQYKAGTYGYISTGYAWLYNEGINGNDMTLATPDADYDYAYVAYKVSADDGNVIDQISFSIKGYTNAAGSNGAQRYEVAVFIFDKLDADSDGKINFGGKTPALLVGDTAAVDFRTNAKTGDFDFVGTLGEHQDAYIVVVPFISWTNANASDTLSGYGTTRARFAALDVTATQKAATPAATEPADSGNSGESGNTSPTTSDAMIAVAAVAVVCGAVLVVAKKRK